MKKVREILLITILFCVFFPTTGKATEELLDNEFQLKTDRLEEQKKQKENNKVVNDEALFNEEITKKIGQQLEKKQEETKKQKDELFVTPEKEKNQDEEKIKNLFTATDNIQHVEKSQENVDGEQQSVKSVLIISALLIIIVLIGALLSYRTHRKEVQNGTY